MEKIKELSGMNETEGRSSTFVFEEGHTFGNALRSIITTYPEVEMCGYTLPHPSENKLHFRIQTYGPRALDVLKKGLEDFEKVCDQMLASYKKEAASFVQET